MNSCLYPYPNLFPDSYSDVALYAVTNTEIDMNTHFYLYLIIYVALYLVPDLG